MAMGYSETRTFVNTPGRERERGGDARLGGGAETTTKNNQKTTLTAAK